MLRKSLWGFSVICLLVIAPNCSSQDKQFATSSDGTKVCFEKRGEGQPALVFVHGFSLTRKFWDDQVEYFSPKHQTVAIDLAGFGESDTTRKDWTVPAMAEDVMAVIKQLNLNQVVLIGHSMGGPVIIEVAKRIPEKVIGLVLVDILQNIDDVSTQEEIDGKTDFYKAAWKNPKAWKISKSDSVIQRFVDQLPDKQPDYWWPILQNTIEWINQCKTELPQIQTPIISINSDQVSTNVSLLQQYAPVFKVKIIPNTGHLLSWEEPDKFNQTLEETIAEFEMLNERK